MTLNFNFSKLICLFLVFLISACGLSRVKTSSEEQLINVPLAPDEGILVLGMKSDSFVDGVYLFGNDSFVADFKKGNRFDFNRQFWVAKVKSGDYSFVQIDFNGNFYTSLEEKALWTVTVKPQQINYIGDLEIELILEDDLFFKTELMNRSSYALEYIEQEYPYLASNYRFAFSGVGKDEFSSLVNKWEKK